MKFSHILLDADRTLFDFDRAERDAFVETANAYHLPHSEELYPIYQRLNDALWALHERGQIEKDALRVERFARLRAQQGLSLDEIAFNRDYTEALSCKSYLFEDALPVCQALAQRYVLLLATNGTASVQTRRFAASPIRPLFQKIYISEQIGVPKPDPRFFAHILRDQKIAEPARALMVGDSLRADISGAAGAGIASCWFNPSRLPCPPEVQPVYIIHTLAELLEIL